VSRPGSSLWRHRDFMRLWSAETISQLGTQVTMLALPLTAILILSASPFEVGALSSAEFAPFLIVGLPAGVWVDRMRRRPILIVGDLGRAAILASIPIAHWLGVLTIWQLYVAAFAVGVCTVFFDVAYQSYLPSLVERDKLLEGNAKLEISRSGAQLAGPGLAGALVQLVSAPVAIAADAASYVGSALFVLSIRGGEGDAERASQPQGRMRAQIGEGLGYVLRHPLLRPIAACTSISNLFSSMGMAIVVLFAVRELDLSPGAIGIAFAIGNAGLLGGAFFADRLAGPVGLGRTIIVSIVVAQIGAVALPLATPSTAVPVLAAAQLLFGVGAIVYNVNQVGLRQAITPDRMLGRMNATMRFVVWGTLPIGALVGGALGEAIGLRPTLWVAAIGGLFSVVPPLLSPVRSLRRIPEVDEAGAIEASGEAARPPEPRPASAPPRSGGEASADQSGS
jgi:MFS family permease